MANRWQLRRLNKNIDSHKIVEKWNRWRDKYPYIQPDLSESRPGCFVLLGINFSEANLQGSNLNAVYLNGANLNSANLNSANLNTVYMDDASLESVNLEGADLRGALARRVNLNRANLKGVDLGGAQLTGADLRGADLRGANIMGTNLSRANLNSANLKDAVLLETAFGNTNLGNTFGLEDCKHFGSSWLDPHTIRCSGGLPDIFLRGCGYLDWQIEAAHLHRKNISQQEIIDITYRISNLKAGNPIEYQSCSISYSSADEPFCRKLHDALQASGVRCWFSPEHIRWGEKLRQQIDAAIHQQERLLLVLTETSLQSPWVEYEIRRAIAREQKEQRRILFPLRLVDFDVLRDWTCFDDDSGKDLAREVREFFIPDDFTNWEDNTAFAAAFERLLANLRQGYRPAKDRGGNGD